MSIINILIPADQEIIQLLRFLEENRGKVKKSQICQALKISQKKLRNLITTLETRFKNDLYFENELHQLCIGYRGHASFASVKNQIFQESVNHQLLLAMLTDNELTYEKLADQLYLSVSSISRYLSILKPFLSAYYISVTKLQLVGEELQIRRFYLHYFEQVYNLSANVFENDASVDAYCETYISCIEEMENLKLSVYNKYRIRQMIYISHFRSQFGNALQFNYSQIFDSLFPKTSHTLKLKLSSYKERYPERLLVQSEYEAIAQLGFSLPLVPYDGQSMKNFIAYHQLANTVMYQVYQFSRKILGTVFDSISDPNKKRKLEAMLFSISITGLTFSVKQEKSDLKKLHLQNSDKKKAEPYIQFLDYAIQKVNEFVISVGLHPLSYDYLIEQYSLLITQAGIYDDKKMKIGLFLGNNAVYAQVMFEYLETRLKIHPTVDFHNLLYEDGDCDFLITNDSFYASEKKNNFKDILLVNTPNLIKGSEEICQWIFEKIRQGQVKCHKYLDAIPHNHADSFVIKNPL